jgi:hypothetical protein
MRTIINAFCFIFRKYAAAGCLVISFVVILFMSMIVELYNLKHERSQLKLEQDKIHRYVNKSIQLRTELNDLLETEQKHLSDDRNQFEFNKQRLSYDIEQFEHDKKRLSDDRKQLELDKNDLSVEIMRLEIHRRTLDSYINQLETRMKEQQLLFPI